MLTPPHRPFSVVNVFFRTPGFHPVVRQRGRCTMSADIDSSHPNVVVGKPPASDRRFARKLVGIDHTAMGKCPVIGTPTAISVLSRSKIAARSAHPRNRGREHR